MSQASNRDCLGFARRLEEHVAEVRAGKRRPGHLEGCPACARRLQTALALIGPLRRPPVVPACLADPAFLESIHERILDNLAAEPVGAKVRAALRSGVRPTELPWPLQTSELRVDGALREGSRQAPSWIWARMRERVHLIAGRSRWIALRRAGLLAASIGLFALLGWKLGRPEGTSADLQIVFVPVTEMPAVLHPAAILRQGGYR